MAETSSISMVESSQTQLTTEVLVIRTRYADNLTATTGLHLKVQKEFLSEEIPARARNRSVMSRNSGKVEEMHHIPHDSKAALKLSKVTVGTRKL